MIVSNSSPIIILGKQGKLELLKECFQKVVIPKAVFNEVMQLKSNKESIALKKAISEKWIFVENILPIKTVETNKLGEGEKEAISLAAKYKAKLIIDDDDSKTYASLVGVEAHGTLFVVYAAFIKNIISKAEAISIFKRMIADGFYVSTDLYSRFLELLD